MRDRAQQMAAKEEQTYTAFSASIRDRSMEVK